MITNKPADKHEVNTTLVGAEVHIPGYQLKFFIEHRVETDTTKEDSIRTRLDTPTHKANN